MEAIKLTDVTKIYRLYDKTIDRLKEVVSPAHKIYQTVRGNLRF